MAVGDKVKHLLTLQGSRRLFLRENSNGSRTATTRLPENFEKVMCIERKEYVSAQNMQID